MSNELPSLRIGAGDLLQHVSRVAYRNTALHFGRDGTNRYDAPARDYGVLYLGMDLPTALMESVFHKHHWDRDIRRSIALVKVIVDIDLADHIDWPGFVEKYRIGVEPDE